MTAPLVGITTSRTLSPTGLTLHAITEQYVQAVLQAGGLPVLIPLGLSEEAMAEMLPRLGGLLFSGGGDLHPNHYKADVAATAADVALPLIRDIDEDRDRIEIRLVQDAARQGMPFLGICRGIQVINVALGGSLYADIRAERPDALKHDYYPELPRNHLAHPVLVEPSSRLAEILGVVEPEVNSLHHQGVNKLAGPLQASALAPDGLVEAIELREHPFGIAVQWHPEWLLTRAPMRRLFSAFIAAATDRMSGRAASITQ